MNVGTTTRHYIRFSQYRIWCVTSVIVYLQISAWRSGCCRDLLSFFVLILVLLCPPSHSLSLSLSLWKRSEVAVTRAIRDLMFLLTVKRRQGYTHIHVTRRCLHTHTHANTDARTHTHTQSHPPLSSAVTGTGQKFTLLLC